MIPQDFNITFFETSIDPDISYNTYVSKNSSLQYLCTPYEIDPSCIDHSFIYHDPKTEYLLLKSITEDSHHRSTFLSSPSTALLNRHSNIIPFQHNSVPINPSIPLSQASNYINASFITGPNKMKFISAQNPLESTITSFWLMIIYHRISFVVLFSYTFEESGDKFIPYWPSQENIPLMVKDSANGNAYKIKLKSHVTIVEKYVIMREFDVFCGENCEAVLSVKHYHVNCWEEHALPLQQIGFQVCDDLIIKIDEQVKLGYNAPVLVHCSDGVGRSGTFIALFIVIKSLMMQKEKNVDKPKFNVFNVVRKLREERYGMVTDASMFKYIYDFSKKWMEMFYNE